MNSLKFWIIFALLLASLTPVGASGRVGPDAPNILVQTIAGRQIDLHQLVDEGPVLISFWATWCSPCLDELKDLARLHHKYASEGLTILAISIDGANTMGRVASVSEKFEFPYHVAIDKAQRIRKLYRVNVPPFSFLVNRDATIVYRHSGFHPCDEKKIEKQIRRLLKKTKAG